MAEKIETRQKMSASTLCLKNLETCGAFGKHIKQSPQTTFERRSKARTYAEMRPGVAWNTEASPPELSTPKPCHDTGPIQGQGSQSRAEFGWKQQWGY